MSGVRSSLRQAVWLLPCALAIHEIEEWNIVPWLTCGRTLPAATALLGVVPAVLYVSRRACEEREVSRLFLAATLALALVPLASAVAVGNTLLPEHLATHRFFVHLAEWAWGAA